uniref:Uncharacterized protein n=1 Tax=mine drainage metagenome TaxID=410659 RepID=E6PLP8_9ZZZZ
MPVGLNAFWVTSLDCVDYFSFVGHLSFYLSESSLHIIAATNLVLLSTEMKKVYVAVFYFCWYVG